MGRNLSSRSHTVRKILRNTHPVTPWSRDQKKYVALARNTRPLLTEGSLCATRRTEKWFRPGIPDQYLLKIHRVLQDELKGGSGQEY